MLKLQDFSKTYRGGKKAVSGLTLTVAPGDICGFIGRNGAGKTTTIRCIAGVLDFEGGDILVNGHSIRREPLACKQVMAYVPDNPDLYDYLTGVQYLNFIADVFNVGAAEYTTMREDYQAVLDRAGFGKKIVGLPARPVIWTLRFLEKLHLSPLYMWVYETACTDSFVSIDKAREKIGFAPKFSNKQALVRNYDWYVEHLADFKGKSGVSHRVPWKQGILALAKAFF